MMDLNRPKFRPLLTLLLLIVFLSPFSTTSAASKGSLKNVIIISWDGVNRDRLQGLFDRDELPSLKRLISEGSLIPLTVKGHNTDTKAGHTEMLTGYPPQVTGVKSNRDFNAIPEGLSIFERLEATYGEDNVETLFITGKAGNIGSKKTSQLGRRRGKGRRRGPPEPWYLIKPGIDIWLGDQQRNADEVGQLAIEKLKGFFEASKGEEKHLVAFIHFSDPDHNGHKYGEGSKEYLQAIVECDRWLGNILDAIGENESKTLIIVSTDHGFDKGQKSHRNAPDIFLAANIRLDYEGGTQADIVPTIYQTLGIDYPSLEPALPGRSLVTRKISTVKGPERSR